MLNNKHFSIFFWMCCIFFPIESLQITFIVYCTTTNKLLTIRRFPPPGPCKKSYVIPNSIEWWKIGLFEGKSEKNPSNRVNEATKTTKIEIAVLLQ